GPWGQAVRQGFGSPPGGIPGAAAMTMMYERARWQRLSPPSVLAASVPCPRGARVRGAEPTSVLPAGSGPRRIAARGGRAAPGGRRPFLWLVTVSHSGERPGFGAGSVSLSAISNRTLTADSVC